jgi:hypothetical protein
MHFRGSVNVFVRMGLPAWIRGGIPDLLNISWHLCAARDVISKERSD